MNRVVISPSTVNGVIQAPASKSSMQRACAAALLCSGTSLIRSPGKSNDDKAAMDTIRKLGAVTRLLQNGDLEIKSNGVQPVSNEINCGEAGLGIRMFTPLAALSEKKILVTGSGSLVNRPMDFFDAIFPKLGIAIQTSDGKLPIAIRGPLKPTDISIDGSLSSQFLTGLLMAYAAAGAAGKTITVKNLKSKPYIDLTLDVLLKFGVKVENQNYQAFYFPENAGKLKTAEYTVEGDWSGAAFLLVAGALGGELTVNGIDTGSSQADKMILEALKKAGALLDISAVSTGVSRAELKAFDFDATDCPDLFPPLVALASVIPGTTVIKGVSRLEHKESNRALTLQQEFEKMGVDIILENDLMKITGTDNLKTAKVHSHHDHRIAMACAVAAIRSRGNIIIEDASAVDKSYPDFYRDLQTLGVSINQQVN